MEPIQANTHSFIVKIWVTESTPENSLVTWQGQITHVPSGERRYFTDFGELRAFMTVYLQQLGVKPTWQDHLRQWWRG